MRNFSMKKLGTPIAAGPGVAEENPGFCGVGLPSGLVNKVGLGAWRSTAVVWWLRLLPTLDADCSEVFLIAPLDDGAVEVPRVGWLLEGAGELGVDCEPPPPEGEPPEGLGGVSGVEGTGTFGAGTGRLGVGGSVGVVTGPIVSAGVGPVPGVNAAVRAPAPSSATTARRRRTRLRRSPLAAAVGLRAARLALSSGSVRIEILQILPPGMMVGFRASCAGSERVRPSAREHG